MTPKDDEADRLERWKANVANGSQVYADVSSRRLRAFLGDAKTTATSLADLDVQGLRSVLEDYLAREKKRGHSGEYIRTTLKAVRSWRVYNGKPYVEGLKVPNSTLSPRTEGERMPTPEDLRRVLLAAKPHERVSISLMAFSGLRPAAIGSYDGTDGLTVGDLPELKVSGTTVEFQKVPTLVRVRAKNSKAKHGYFTFLGEEGCLAVRQMLEQRIIAGEKVDSKTDVVHPERASKKFIRALNVGDGIRRAMRAAGLDQRPYIWRAYFLSRLLEASNSGKVTDRYAEFWAGHTGDVTSRHYTTGRANLSASMIEDMRAAYKRCQPFLSTTAPVQTSAEEIQREAAVLLLTGFRGKTEAEARKLVEGKAGSDLAELLKSNTKPREQAVPVGDVPKLLGDGWEFVSALSGTMAVVRGPAPVPDLRPS
jgi:integrase